MIEKNEFMYKKPRMLPVILLLDVSGSMATNGHINVLNNSVNEMIAEFKSQSSTIADIAVAIICFGNASAEVFQPLESASNIVKINMTASGMTPLGDALRKAKAMIEDKTIIDSRSYRPTIIVVSDGYPNDDWEESLDKLVNEGRSSKCYRYALGIDVANGSTPHDVLVRFCGNEEGVFDAKNAKGITRFFRYMTMSTTSRAQSSNPNLIPENIPQPEEEDEDDDYRPF